MGGNAGPTGSGLLPPNGRRDQDDERDRNPIDDEDIDGLPPVVDDGDDQDDHDVEDDVEPESRGQDDRLEERLAAMEERFQRRFDKAISRITKNMEKAQRGSRDPDDVDDDDDPEDERPRKNRRRRDEQPRRDTDVTSIRLLARDQIADAMEKAGSAEKRTVKAIVDKILPAVDWSRVEDQDEFVEDLVKTLQTASFTLVKEGSDRKVAQLRRMGVLDERKRQPPTSGGGLGPSGTDTRSKMEKGAAVAATRFQGGKRRLRG